MKVVVVIPTFNERENIARLIFRVCKVSSKLRGFRLEILVVDDSSPDGTAKVVQEEARKNKKVHFLLRKKKEGLGAAYLTGMKEAFLKLQADVVLFMDADLSHNPDYIPHFLERIKEGSHLVVGSRYVKGGSVAKSWMLHRKILSAWGNKTVSLFLGHNFSDWTSGFRAIKKEVYIKISPKMKDTREFKGYTFNISFAYYAKISGFVVSTIPIRFIDRTNGKSKLGLEYLFNTPIFLIKTRLKGIFKGIV